MKKLLFLSFLLTTIISNAQPKVSGTYNWILSKAETYDSIEINNDLNYYRIRINERTLDFITGDIFNESNAIISSYNYLMLNDTLYIRTEPVTKFKIENISENNLILFQNQKRYYFNKLIIEEDKAIFGHDDYKILSSDTSAIVLASKYKGDFIKHFTTDLNTNGSDESSFVIEASFFLKANKQIDSIKILTPTVDSTIIIKAMDMIKSSQKMWDPALSLKYKKTDIKIFITILFKSAKLKSFKYLNYVELGNDIFKKAIEEQNNGHYIDAEQLYTEYIALYKFLIVNYRYIGIYSDEMLLKSLNNSLFNRAAMRIEQGKVEDACNDFMSISGILEDIQEAQKYLNNYCK